MNRDPKGEKGGINLYSFVLNDPIVGHDSLGLERDPTECQIYFDLYRQYSDKWTYTERYLSRVNSLISEMFYADFDYNSWLATVHFSGVYIPIKPEIDKYTEDAYYTLKSKKHFLEMDLSALYYDMNRYKNKYNDCIGKCYEQGIYCRYFTSPVGAALDAAGIAFAASGVGIEGALIAWSISFANNVYAGMVCGEYDSAIRAEGLDLVSISVTSSKHLPGWLGKAADITSLGFNLSDTSSKTFSDQSDNCEYCIGE